MNHSMKFGVFCAAWIVFTLSWLILVKSKKSASIKRIFFPPMATISGMLTPVCFWWFGFRGQALFVVASAAAGFTLLYVFTTKFCSVCYKMNTMIGFFRMPTFCIRCGVKLGKKV